MPKPDIAQDIKFLFEMGNIRLIDRTWRRFLAVNFANLAEHHFRMFWLAMIIAAREGNVDTGKIAKMVLVHDISESRTGDVDYISRQYVKRDEKLAIKDMLAGSSIESEFYQLWEEYEKRESAEAKIVKDADQLDVDMELAEQKAMGNTISDLFHNNHRKSVVKDKLFTKTARDMFDEIVKANPHDWHLKGRNRINSGDWKS